MEIWLKTGARFHRLVEFEVNGDGKLKIGVTLHTQEISSSTDSNTGSILHTVVAGDLLVSFNSPAINGSLTYTVLATAAA